MRASHSKSPSAAFSTMKRSLKKGVTPGPYLEKVFLDWTRVYDAEHYAFKLPALQNLDSLDFHPKVTFLFGENGSGKSTFLEALAISRQELSRMKRYHTVDTSLADGTIGISYLNNNNFLARVGEGCKLRFRCFTEQKLVGKREIVEEFELGPGLYTVCLIHDHKSSLFGCCVNQNLHVHAVPDDVDAAVIGQIGYSCPSFWLSVWR
jgi:hypothetical protein